MDFFSLIFSLCAGLIYAGAVGHFGEHPEHAKPVTQDTLPPKGRRVR